MRSISTLARGAAVTGALTLLCAPVAAAAGTSTLPSTSALAAAGGENARVNLGTTATSHAASSSGGSSIVRTIIALVVVIGIIYAIARILRALKGRDTVRASGSGLTQIATLPLGPNKSVAVVRAGREIVLIGVAESGVTALKTYTEAEAIEAGIDLPPADEGSDAGQRSGSSFGAAEGALDRLRRFTVRS